VLRDVCTAIEHVLVQQLPSKRRSLLADALLADAQRSLALAQELLRSSVGARATVTARTAALRASWLLNVLLDLALPLLEQHGGARPFAAQLLSPATVQQLIATMQACATMTIAKPLVDVLYRLLLNRRFFASPPDVTPLQALARVVEQRIGVESASDDGPMRLMRPVLSFEVQALVRLLLVACDEKTTTSWLAELRSVLHSAERGRDDAELTREQETALMALASRLNGRSLTKKTVSRSTQLRGFSVAVLERQLSVLTSLSVAIASALPFVDLSSRADVLGPLRVVFANLHLLSASGEHLYDLLRRRMCDAYVSAIEVQLDRLRTPSDIRLAGDDSVKAARTRQQQQQQQQDDSTRGPPPRILIGKGIPPAPAKVRLTIIAQAAGQLASLSAGLLARHDEALFSAKFLGEGGADAGGVYREALSMICRDVMSGEAGLCIPTPNARHNVGERRGDRLPVLLGGERADVAERVLLFEFLGMLIGHSVRREARLDLDFPLLFWKQLIGAEQPTLDDLEHVDAIAHASLKRMLLDGGGSGGGGGDDARFVATGSDEREILLRRGGDRMTVVDAASAQVYVSECVAARCAESYAAAQHVRRGLARMVPLPALRLFDAAQLARRVCGEPTIDLAELRRNTSSRVGKATTDMLFDVLAKLSAADQRRFVQFVYGQSRLPANFDNGSFNIERRPVRVGQNPDRVLPTAGTCDFSIALPRYSTAAILHERLLYAIHNCAAIDADDNASSFSDDDDEDRGDDDDDEDRGDDEVDVDDISSTVDLDGSGSPQSQEYEETDDESPVSSYDTDDGS